MNTPEISNIDKYYLSKDAPINNKELMQQLDFIFAAYLNKYKEKGVFLRKLVTKKWWITKILKDIFKNKLIFDTNNSYNSDNLYSTLTIFSTLLNEYYYNNKLLQEKHKRIKWSGTLLSMRQYFNNNTLNYKHVDILELFFRKYLKEKWIIREKNNNSELIISDINRFLVKIKAIEKHHNIDWNQKLKDLFILLKNESNNLSSNRVKWFFDGVNELITVENEHNPNDFFNLLISKFKNHFPEVYWNYK